MPKSSRKKTLKLNIINFCKLPRQCFGSIGNRLFGSNNTTKSSKSKKKRRNSLNSLSTYQKSFVQLNINNNNNNNSSCNSLNQLKENLIKNYNYSSNEEKKSEHYNANDDDLTFYDAIEYLDSNSTDIFFDIKSLNNSINRQTTLDSFHTTQTAQIIRQHNKSSIDLIFNIVGYIVSWTPEFFSCLGYIVSWTPEFFSCLGYIVSCGYPTRTHTRTRGNSVAHVCI